jgi:hypothetical protein
MSLQMLHVANVSSWAACSSDVYVCPGTLSQTIHTLPLPPTPITYLDPDSRSVEALLVGSDLGSVNTRFIVGIYLSTSGAAFNISQTQGGSWIAPLALGGNYCFSPRSALVTQALANGYYNYQARTFGIVLTPSGLGPMQEVSNRSFSTPASLGGLFTSKTAVASAAHDSLDVFGLGTDSNLYHKHITDSATQVDWAQVGTNFTGFPIAVVATPGLIELLGVRKGDLAVLHATFNPITNAASAWAPVNGNVYANLSACSRTSGTLDLVVLGTDYAIYYNHFNGSSWGGWVALGGKSLFGRRPSICSWSANRLDVCVTGKTVATTIAGLMAPHGTLRDGSLWV